MKNGAAPPAATQPSPSTFALAAGQSTIVRQPLILQSLSCSSLPLLVCTPYHAPLTPMDFIACLAAVGASCGVRAGLLGLC